jgi:hypothetical protein
MDKQSSGGMFHFADICIGEATVVCYQSRLITRHTSSSVSIKSRGTSLSAVKSCQHSEGMLQYRIGCSQIALQRHYDYFYYFSGM